MKKDYNFKFVINKGGITIPWSMDYVDVGFQIPTIKPIDVAVIQESTKLMNIIVTSFEIKPLQNINYEGEYFGYDDGSNVSFKIDKNFLDYETIKRISNIFNNVLTLMYDIIINDKRYDLYKEDNKVYEDENYETNLVVHPNHSSDTAVEDTLSTDTDFTKDVETIVKWMNDIIVDVYNNYQEDETDKTFKDFKFDHNNKFSKRMEDYIKSLEDEKEKKTNVDVAVDYPKDWFDDLIEDDYVMHGEDLPLQDVVEETTNPTWEDEMIESILNKDFDGVGKEEETPTNIFGTKVVKIETKEDIEKFFKDNLFLDVLKNALK